MAKFQVVAVVDKGQGERTDPKTGEVKRAYSMRVADGIFTDDQQSFSCELAFFEKRDRNGVVVQPLPDVRKGGVYEVVPRFYKATGGKLGTDFTLRPVAAVKAA